VIPGVVLQVSIHCGGADIERMSIGWISWRVVTDHHLVFRTTGRSAVGGVGIARSTIGIIRGVIGVLGLLAVAIAGAGTSATQRKSKEKNEK
jgi:hypothetical protein